MNEIYDFLKQCGCYYIATDDNGQPRVRVFGTIDIFEGGLYIQTSKDKKVSAQMHKNPKIEICAFDGTYWLRLQAEVVEDTRVEAQAHILNAYPALKKMYTAGDGNTEAFKLTNVVANMCSFTTPPREIKL